MEVNAFHLQEHQWEKIMASNRGLRFAADCVDVRMMEFEERCQTRHDTIELSHRYHGLQWKDLNCLVSVSVPLET